MGCLDCKASSWLLEYRRKSCLKGLQGAPRTVRQHRLSCSSPAKHKQLLQIRAETATTEVTKSPESSSEERFRLHNIAPQKGARRKNLRKGRGYAAGKGGSCGFGMRGQNSRSGPGVRPGFEGGQLPLYRRLPKLRGIAGGMSAGLPKYVTVNLRQLSAFQEKDEVSLDILEQKRILNPTGRDGRLPLKVLGDGEISIPLTIKAESFSASAKEKIENAGGTIVKIPGTVKWTRAIGRQRAKAAAASPKAKAK